MTIRVSPATSAETSLLRHAVLRPGRAMGVLDSPIDEVAVCVAAWDGEAMVGCVRINPAAYDGSPDAWQLGGMAVDPSYQGQGIGRLVAQAIVAEARRREIPLLWANARTSVLGFYISQGWVAHGEEFIHSGSQLPHYVITLDLGTTVGRSS